MAAASDDEIRGDWSNLKGTEYHLVYALWLLLKEQASEVAFYEGNDLRASPIAPPLPDGMSGASAVIPIHLQRGQKDVWIQLKSTFEPWTPGAFLEGNLLENFLCNAFTSSQNGRDWEVRLVTQGIVKGKDLLAFVEEREKQPGPHRQLDRIITSFRDRLAKEGVSPVPDEPTVRRLALDILKLLSGTQPVALTTLKAEVEVELAYVRPDRRAVERTACLLLGAMLRDAAAGPGKARTYNAQWLEEVGGPGIKSDRPFDRDVITACDLIVARELPRDWDAARHVPRSHLRSLLRQFLGAGQPLFVLQGRSVTGKSWAVADWMTRDLVGHVRLLVPGHTLDVAHTLDGLVAHCLSPLTAAILKDEEYLARLSASGVGRGSGPPIIVVDGLPIPQSVDVLRRDLGRLSSRARAAGVKLVLICQKETWELYQLWREIPSADIFTPNPLADAERRRYSFELVDFTPDEVVEAVARRLSEPQGERAGHQLRAPGFVPLRNPYLLGLYINQHGQHLGQPGSSPDPVVVDGLLARRVQEQIQMSAALLNADVGSMEAALRSLVTLLWDSRPGGIPQADAVRALMVHLPEQGKQGLEAFQRVGLVTTQGGVRLAEAPVAAHLLASHLTGLVAGGEEVWSQLSPTRDGEVMAAFIRMQPDPVAVAESLLRRDGCWAASVAAGQAQCSPDDPRVVAMLAGLARPAGDGIVAEDGCRALGLLAARGERAWGWVLRMYVSGHSQERHRGEYALGTALEVVPEKVGQAIRLRMAQERQKASSPPTEEQVRRLTDALGPLHHVNHRVAADVARALIADAGCLVPPRQSPEVERFTDAIDDIRGRVALFGATRDVEQLCMELTASDAGIRYRAAGALRPVAFEAPEQVRPALLQALLTESDPRTLCRLLWMSFRVLQAALDDFLNALASSRVVRWDDAIVAGPALAILASGARLCPSIVLRLLPRRLDACEPWARAILSELLAYAWWCCAEHDPSARAHLNTLADPDLEGVPDPFRTFALRGAAVARLGQVCIGRVSADGMGVRMVHFREAGLPYLFLDADEFFQQHAMLIGREPGCARVAEALVESIRAQDQSQADLRQDALRNAQYLGASNSLQILIHAAALQPDPILVVAGLPRDWQALRGARLLLEAGRSDPSVVAFARQACEESAHSHTVQAAHDRELCLAQLSRLAGTPEAGLESHRRSLEYSFFATGGQARGLATLVDEHPGQFLNLLDSAIRTQEDIPVLHGWEQESRSWQGLLAASVYARMFDPRALELSEARELVGQMLVVLRSLPPSPQRTDHEAVYVGVAGWLAGDVRAVDRPSASGSPIQASHVLTADLLARVAQAVQHQEEAEWLQQFLADRRGWWETTHWQLKNGTLSRGSGLYLIYAFPAVRLALAAVGQRYGLPDPGGSLMETRYRAAEAIGRHQWLWMRDGIEPKRLERGLADLEVVTANMPHDERLWYRCGDLLLRLGRLEEARDRLEHCLRLPFCEEDIRASVLYDLACVHAQAGREAECRQALDESRAMRPLDVNWIVQDPDLESIRSTAWFQALLPNATSQT